MAPPVPGAPTAAHVHRPKCLMVTQSNPARGGHGTSIRAGLTLEALAQRFDVTLLVVTELRHNHETGIAQDLAACCATVISLHVPAEGDAGRHSPLQPRALRWNKPQLALALARLRDRHFDHVHVQRLSLLPVWQTLQTLGASSDWTVLDLDDIESRAAARQMRQSWRELGWVASAREALESAKLYIAESKAIRHVDKMIICSEGDRLTLAHRMPPEKLAIVPNALHYPAQPFPAREATRGPLRLLFVGSLFYQPNVDGARWLLDELLPHLAAHSHLDCTLAIVGRRPPDWLLGRHDPPRVTVQGDVPDIAICYRESDIVLAPIRAGGGTRIKIIEALASGRPVVCTQTGAEGLAVKDGQEILLAESAEDFARQIERLAADPHLRARLAAAGRRVVERLYSPQAFGSSLLAAHVPASGQRA